MTNDPDLPRNNLEYEDALHGVQSGVAWDQGRNPDSFKHLRVGINSAHVSNAALARLLVKKGLITYEEFAEELRLEANRELDRYEDRASEVANTQVHFR